MVGNGYAVRKRMGGGRNGALVSKANALMFDLLSLKSKRRKNRPVISKGIKDCGKRLLWAQEESGTMHLFPQRIINGRKYNNSFVDVSKNVKKW